MGYKAAACIVKGANKALVLTLPARGSFHILARHTRLGGGLGFVLPLRARAGRTMQAFGSFLHSAISSLMKKMLTESVLRNIV